MIPADAAAVEAEMEAHQIRLLPTDWANARPKDDEWRTECSCGWVSPTGTGQGLAAEHWLNHTRAVRAAILGGAA